MKKDLEAWSVRDLQNRYRRINFPQYQREPNLWSLIEKQRLIDSMIRRFDIASLYFYGHTEDEIDCVDGRQRIGAIMAFLGENEADDHAGFPYRILNEIYDDTNAIYKPLCGKTYAQIESMSKSAKDSIAKKFIDRFLAYEMTAVMLSDSIESQEFNLQFTRLNLGTIINSGEKLHAMVGDLRDECFNRLGKHQFLADTNIPTRRFAREQVAAQILAQVFSLNDAGDFARTRHFDLQGLFKTHSTLADKQKILICDVSQLLDLLGEAFRELSTLRNRAITVSTVLLAWQLKVREQHEASNLAEFIDEFTHRLNWQIKMGVRMDHEYHHLTDFQYNISQASSERSSVAARAQMLHDEFQRWQTSKELRGDAAWRENHPGRDPSAESKS